MQNSNRVLFEETQLDDRSAPRFTRKQLPTISSPVAIALLSNHLVASHKAVQALQNAMLPQWGRCNMPAFMEIALHQQTLQSHAAQFGALGSQERLVINTAGDIQKRDETAHNWSALAPVLAGDLKLFETAKGRVLSGTLVADPMCTVRPLYPSAQHSFHSHPTSRYSITSLCMQKIRIGHASTCILNVGSEFHIFNAAQGATAVRRYALF